MPQRLTQSVAEYLVLLLDELALIPSRINLDLTLVKGREAGILLIGAYQSQAHCRVVQGKDQFDAMTGLMKTTIILNLPGREDAEYAAKCLADHQGFLNVSADSQQFVTLENVTASMIQSLPVPTPANPVIEGFMATLPYRPFYFRISIPELLKTLVPSVQPKAPPAPRRPEDFILRPWTDADLGRLRLDRRGRP